MAYIDFVLSLHRATKRDYVGRVTAHDKAESAAIAKQFGQDYWDGERHLGYGGYHYDGRWLPVAEAMVKHYGLKAGDRILDIGCGKGFLLHEFTRAAPGVEIAGLDISAYGIAHAKDEVKPALTLGNANKLPYADDSFDFVVSLGALHNLKIYDLYAAFAEIERVAKPNAPKYVMVESYRDEREKANLLYWQLTCESFYAPDEWEWIHRQTGYGGDHGFIYFE